MFKEVPIIHRDLVDIWRTNVYAIIEISPINFDGNSLSLQVAMAICLAQNSLIGYRSSTPMGLT